MSVSRLRMKKTSANKQNVPSGFRLFQLDLHPSQVEFLIELCMTLLERRTRPSSSSLFATHFLRSVVSLFSHVVVTAIVAMYIEASVIAYVAFAFPLVTAPFAIRQRRKLHKLSTFEQQINEIRVLVNDLTTENNQLQQENGKLEAQVAKLQHVQDEFQNLVQESDGDVRTMKELAKEYRSIQREMQSLTKATKMQKFLQAIFRSDTNRNFELDSPQEIDLLVHRLKLIGNLDFDEGRLRDSIHNSDKKSLTTIYVVASGTLDEDDNGDGDVEMT